MPHPWVSSHRSHTVEASVQRSSQNCRKAVPAFCSALFLCSIGVPCSGSHLFWSNTTSLSPSWPLFPHSRVSVSSSSRSVSAQTESSTFYPIPKSLLSIYLFISIFLYLSISLSLYLSILALLCISVSLSSLPLFLCLCVCVSLSLYFSISQGLRK